MKLKRGVGGSTDRFIQLPHYMLKSAAWRSLPGEAIKLLIEVWRRHNGVNNGEISFACSEAPNTVGFSKATAARMFKILVDRGFLAVVRKAQFKSPWARSWRLTAERWRDRPATKEYMQWRPPKNDSRVSSMRLTSLNRETGEWKSINGRLGACLQPTFRSAVLISSSKKT